jgi:predicted nucleic acid-binding protein
MLYLDSSALLKLVIEEKESRALVRFLKSERTEHVSCSLVRTEVLRATRRHGATALERARSLLQTLQLVQLADTLLDAAGILEPMEMRSLDAIHLAAAALIAPELTALVTYNKRMAEGAALLGFPVVSPA